MKASQVIPTWRALHAFLVAAAPAAGITEAEVLLGPVMDPPPAGVMITGAENASMSTAVTLGGFNARDEVFALNVVAFVNREAMTTDEVLSELDVYAQFVQNALRDPLTGTPTSYFQTALNTRPVIVEVTGFYPVPTATPRGVFGEGQLDVRFTVRH